MLDRRFPTALQIMQSFVLAELHGMGFISSTEVAEGLRANPTLVRRLLSTLVRHELLESQMGRNGGVRLARAADTITLREIYTAAIADKKLWTTRPDLPQRCVVSSNFEEYFEKLICKADSAILDLLGQQTLAQSFSALVDLDLARDPKNKERGAYIDALRSGALRAGEMPYEHYNALN